MRLLRMLDRQNEDWERNQQTAPWQILEFWENSHGYLPQKWKPKFLTHPNLKEISTYHPNDVERAITANLKLVGVIDTLRVLRMKGIETKKRQEPIILPTIQELEIDRFQTGALDWDIWRNKA